MQLPGFDYQRIEVDGVGITTATAGSGTPVLLLHGYPETHAMWRHVAPGLAEPRLAGQGASAAWGGGTDDKPGRRGRQATLTRRRPQTVASVPDHNSQGRPLVAEGLGSRGIPVRSASTWHAASPGYGAAAR